MVNYNGTIQENSGILIENNRGFLFGDCLFETFKVVANKVLFLEDHYFRLMASMRICRMEIPMNFTMEFMENQILKLIPFLDNNPAHRIRLSVFRKSGGFYKPNTNEIDFLITGFGLNTANYQFSSEVYEVELYKDAQITKQLFATLKTNNKMIQIAGSIFAEENQYDNCLLLNDEKNVVEALQANVFMKMDNTLITPPITDGCLNGIMRKQILTIAQKIEGITVVEKSISPFDLQKAEELFLTNTIVGIQPITKYRKKSFESGTAREIVKRLNAQILLS